MGDLSENFSKLEIMCPCKEVVTQAKRELKEATGLKAGTVAKKITKDKA